MKITRSVRVPRGMLASELIDMLNRLPADARVETIVRDISGTFGRLIEVHEDLALTWDDELPAAAEPS